MKAIETRAYGCRFRSRLEARWAVFFTALGLSWEYEPEGFQVGNHFYLPDFRVYTPQGKPIWYEIKPLNACQDEKFNQFLRSLKTQNDPNNSRASRASLLNGDPYSYFMNNDPIRICPRCGHIGIYEHFYSDGNFFILCANCDAETPCGGGNPIQSDGFLGSHYTPNKGWIEASESTMITINLKQIRAWEKALSARFEHGESPQ